MMTDDFKKIIEEDIVNCNEQIENGSPETRYELMRKLTSKYDSIITDFSKGLHDTWYDDKGTQKLKNIKILKEKLLLFKAMDYRNSFDKSTPQVEIHNSNTNSNIIDINISFDEARQTVENMSALTDSEIEEILHKINDLEKIVQSKDRKSKKWENSKEIIKWIADKGVDVGIALLPLLLQI